MEKWYIMIHKKKWYIIQTCISEVKIKTLKGEWKLKIYTFLIFELKNPRMLILWRRLVLWVKMAATLASHVLVVIFVVA